MQTKNQLQARAERLLARIEPLPRDLAVEEIMHELQAVSA